MKILYVDYESGYVIIEMLGEWNDCINNDIMYFKQEIIEILIKQKINKYVIIGENILNFHASDDSYYEEWHEDIKSSMTGRKGAWITLLNFRKHVLDEMKEINIQCYLNTQDGLDIINWRTYTPVNLCNKINALNKEVLLPQSSSHYINSI